MADKDLPAGDEPLTVADAEAAHAKLIAFLESAPDELRPWAQQQLDAAAADLVAAREREADRLAGRETRADQREANLLGLSDAELDAPKKSATRAPRAPGKRPWFLHPLFLFALAAAAIFAVYYLGDRNSDGLPSDHPSVSATATAEASDIVDPALVKAMEQKVADNPKDAESWRALGQMYDRTGDYAKAENAQRKLIELAPKDVNARLALGVALFNQKKLAEAEKAWQAATSLDPKSAQAYYNLGFLYLSQDKNAQAVSAWEKVIELDPKSTLAEGVKSHLEALKSPSATPSATPTK